MQFALLDFSQLIQDAVCIPDMKIRILCSGISRIGLAGFCHQLPLIINKNGAYIGRAAI